MDTTAGRWLMIVLVVLIAVGIVVLVPLLLRVFEPEPPTQVILPTSRVPTLTPTATATPTPTLTPTTTPTPTPPPTPLPNLIGYTTHRAVVGETLEQLAAHYGSLGPAIASLNRLPPNTPLTEGQPLLIPLYDGQPLSGTIAVRGLEVSRGLPGRRVALTFDAGAASEPAVSILDTLKAHNIQVTFFLTGKWAEDNPDLVRRMAAEGHELANHTYSHPNLTQLQAEAIAREVLRTEQIVRDLAGQTTRPLLRPPYGDRNQAVLDTLAGLGYISIYWTVDSLDSVGDPKTADFLLRRVTQPGIPLEGAVVLMHVGNRTTADALPAILDWFRQEGYAVVKVSEILRGP